MTPITLSASADSSRLVYFGTYTRKASQGIYAARFDTATGTFSPARLVAPGSNPTFLALHPQLPVLYAIGDRNTEEGGKEGALFAYSINPADGSLTLLNSLSAGGGPLCYVHADPTGRAVLASSYHSGYVAAYSINSDGALVARTAFVKHSGKGPHSQQDAPHAHCIDVAPGGRFAFSADLGADKIVPYAFDAAPGSLTPAAAPFQTRPGSGPRHLAFHPNGRFVYAVNELVSTVTAFDFDTATGSLTEIQTMDTIPGDFTGRRWGSEIAIHPNGKFLYTSNRADHESIAVLSIDPDSGHLTFIEHAHAGIKHPRHFAIDPSGRWLLCANHDTDNVNLFALDPTTGRLTPSGQPLPVPSPVCILFAR